MTPLEFLQLHALAPLFIIPVAVVAAWVLADHFDK